MSVMRPQSHFVFTVESCADNLTEKGFRLLKNGRFGYSKSYVDDLVKNLCPDAKTVV
jgi:predicted TPR repeat methyltransferase